MPQLSLYIDGKTLEKIQLAAKLEKLSLSKWVVSKLKDTLENSWPGKYEDLYGALSDESFQVEKNQDFADDIPREEL